MWEPGGISRPWLKYSPCRSGVGIYMKWMKFATAWMILIILVQLVPQPVSGFGIPYPSGDEQGEGGQEGIVLLQRDHYAYVTVLDEHEMEIEFGPFERILKLPSYVDQEEVYANYTNGFLEIRMKKSDEPDDRMEIKIK